MPLPALHRRLVLLGVVLVLVLGNPPAPASAAGVLELDRVPVVEPYLEVLGASPSGVLYRVSRLRDRLVEDSTWVKPADAPAYQVDLWFKRLVGDKIFGATPAGLATYQYIGESVTHTCPGVSQPALQLGRVDGVGLFSSFGWLGENGDRVEVSPTGCRVTAKYPNIGTEALIAMDDTGYVTVKSVGVDGGRELTYRSYAAATSPRVIADGGYNLFIFRVSLAGSVVSWGQNDYGQQPSTHSYVVRSSTDGSVAPKVTRVEGLEVQTAIAGGATSWVSCGALNPPCASGSIRADGTQTGHTDTTRTVVSDGTRFVFDTSGPTGGATAGVDAAATIGGPEPKTRLASVGPLVPVAEVVSVGAGGVAYIDSQPPTDSVNRRLYTQAGSTITLAAQSRIGQSSSFWNSLSREGRRTAFADNTGALWLVADDGVRTKVFTPAERVAVLAAGEVRTSGSRLLWWKGKYSGEVCDPVGPPNCRPEYAAVVAMLFDLRTGVSTELALPATQDRTADLWGNFLTWADAGNAIWRRDLSSGAVLQVKAAGAAAVRSLAVHDDWVAWATCQRSGADQCAQSVLGHRNMQTRAPAIQLTSAHTERVRLSGGHVVYETYPQPSHVPSVGTIKVWRLGTSATGVVGAARWRTSFDVHDETLVWIAPDGIARIGPNSPFVAYPKYLGNGIAPASFSPAMRSWTPEFGISKALPTCSLTIKSGTAVRRVLSCATTTGSARATWDGRDSAGRLLPKGAYTWTLAGRDADGTLRWWTGATHPITGTVTIT